MEKKVVKFIDKAISELEIYTMQYKTIDNQHVFNTMKVLKLLREDVLKNGLLINERVLRAFKDVCTVTSIQYEDSNFNDPLFEVYNCLDELIPSFGNLKLLRNEFGKGDPI